MTTPLRFAALGRTLLLLCCCGFLSIPQLLAQAPANDECATAIALTVNPDFGCGMTTSGTIAGATNSDIGQSPCGGTEDDDVWFTFVATSTTHQVSLVNITGGTSDLYHAVWSGDCGNLVNLTCSDPNTSSVTGLTVGETYTLQVYSWTATAGQTSNFEVCIGTPPPPPANDECADAVALTVNDDFLCGSTTPGTIASATNSGMGNATCGGTEDDDVWYTFEATSTDHRVSLINVTGGTSDLYHVVYSGPCDDLTEVFCSDPNTSNLTGLTVGETYTVQVYSWTSTAGQTSNFDICIGTPPPRRPTTPALTPLKSPYSSRASPCWIALITSVPPLPVKRPIPPVAPSSPVTPMYTSA